jgi:hypothetical protein
MALGSYRTPIGSYFTRIKIVIQLVLVLDGFIVKFSPETL